MNEVTTTSRFAYVIFDLDSTLTDTLATLAATRSALVERLAQATGLAREALAAEARQLLCDDFHNPDLIDRMSLLQAWRRHGGAAAETLLAQEADAYYRDLRRASILLPGVRETLERLTRAGITYVLWSNKKAPFAQLHVGDLGLDGLAAALYCRRSPAPSSLAGVGLQRTRVVELEPGERKPYVETTRRILAENGFEPERTVFVGNNLKKDGGATLGTGVSFVLVDWGIPTRRIQDEVFRLTGSERLSYDIGSRRQPDYEWYRANVPVHATLRRDLSELLPLLGIDERKPVSPRR